MSEVHVIAGLKGNLREAKIQYEKKTKQLQAQVKVLEGENKIYEKQLQAIRKPQAFCKAPKECFAENGGFICDNLQAALQKQTEALEEEIKERNEQEALVCPEDVGFVEYIKVLKAALAQKTEALKKYGSHKMGCSHRLKENGWAKYACICGFEQALTAKESGNEKHSKITKHSSDSQVGHDSDGIVIN